MKNFAIKILLNALALFSEIVISRINVEWVKKTLDLTIKRLKLFGEALTDNDPNDKDQIELIAKQTLMSEEFQALEKHITLEIVKQIPNEKLGNLLLQTDDLRLRFFALLGDENPENKEQIKDMFEQFIKSEEFDTVVINLTELLVEKYAKNEAAKQFIIAMVTSLVNSDDNN